MAARTAEQVRQHYDIEREIAARLRNSTAEERKTLYTMAYDELFSRLPDHPQLVGESAGEKQKNLDRQMSNLRGLVSSDTVFVEIGAGDCALSLEIAKTAKRVVAIDVANEIERGEKTPENFELIISDGSSIPLDPESVDLVYSDQLMEHLHPDDALAQVTNICRALKPGGIYFCVTPNRLSGPHDVSRDFDMVATGLHLREYTFSELEKMFRAAGFSKMKAFLRLPPNGYNLPILPFKVIEWVIESLPDAWRKRLTHNRPSTVLLGVKIVATK